MILKELGVSIFTNSEERNNDKALTKLLFNEFFDSGYLVTNVVLNHFTITSDNGESSIAKVLRPQLVNASTGESIVILPDRIDYRATPIIEEGIIKWPEVEQVENGVSAISKILTLIDKKASRLALNTQYIIETTNIDNNSKAEFMRERDLVETNERYVTREQISDELVNIILESVQNIAPYRISIDGFDYENRIKLIQTDINTHQDSTMERFSSTEIMQYLNEFVRINQQLVNGV